jgi:hypothetical protein
VVDTGAARGVGQSTAGQLAQEGVLGDDLSFATGTAFDLGGGRTD